MTKIKKGNEIIIDLRPHEFVFKKNESVIGYREVLMQVPLLFVQNKTNSRIIMPDIQSYVMNLEIDLPLKKQLKSKNS